MKINKYYKPAKVNELEAVTIINRLGQKSMSLPRIDETKKLRGYPGLAGTAKKIAELVPPGFSYIEPFAGTAKVYQELLKMPKKHRQYLLNDKSPFVYRWLEREFDCLIMNEDFRYIMQMCDDKNSVFLIDAPWHKEIYLQGFSCFDRAKVKDYDEEILELCKKLKGKFLICSDRDNKRMLNSGFRNILIEGEYKVVGGNVKTLVTTNID